MKLHNMQIVFLSIKKNVLAIADVVIMGSFIIKVLFLFSKIIRFQLSVISGQFINKVDFDLS